MDKRPGQEVLYMVVDDSARRKPERVRLEFEAVGRYDTEFYVTELVRACESVVSPLDWDRRRVRASLRGMRDVGLAAFE